MLILRMKVLSRGVPQPLVSAGAAAVSGGRRGGRVLSPGPAVWLRGAVRWPSHSVPGPLIDEWPVRVRRNGGRRARHDRSVYSADQRGPSNGPARPAEICGRSVRQPQRHLNLHRDAAGRRARKWNGCELHTYASEMLNGYNCVPGWLVSARRIPEVKIY